MLPTTQVFGASTVLGVAMLAAAIDDGAFAPADRRVLLVANTSEDPEVTPAPQDARGFAALAGRFDEVIDWNAVLAPLHPAGWYPPPAELPLLGRLVRQHLTIGKGPTELVVDGLATAPGAAIAALLPGCPVTVVSDSLLAWGPPARALSSELAGRVTRLLHLPVLDGLRPLLLADAGARVSCRPVPADRLWAVLAELPAGPIDNGAALLVGDPPGVSDTPAAELLRRVAARGHRAAVLVPHPSCGPDVEHRSLLHLADELGVGLTVTEDGLPAEAVLARSHPALVAGSSSSTLVVARDVFGRTVGSVGAERVLARRPGPEHVSATIVHATVPALGKDGSLTEPEPEPEPDAGPLAALVDTVAYCLSPDVLTDLRDDAARYVSAHGDNPYVSRHRLVALGLAAAAEAPTASNPLRPERRRSVLGGRRSAWFRDAGTPSCPPSR